MIDIVRQTLEYYLEKKEIPSANHLKIQNPELANKKSWVFITLYKNGNIIWSAGSVKELQSNILKETIINTIDALSDKRAEWIKKEDLGEVKIRVDIISSRAVIEESDIENIDPIKSGILVIKKDYSNLAIILPNISNVITSWKDFIPLLSAKLWVEMKPSEYIISRVETEQIADF